MTLRFPVRSLSLLAVSGLALSACGADDGGDAEASAPGGGPSVVAAFYPLAFVAERVAGDHATVENLTAPGVDSHDLELTAQQVATVADADLAIHIDGFQPAVDDAIEQNAPSAVIDAAAVVDLLPDEHADDADESHNHDEAAEAEGESNDEDDHAHDNHNHEGETEDDNDHAHDAETENENNHDDDHTHDHGDLEGDPHLWLDPANMIALTEHVADELAGLDPDNAEAYEANASELAGELEELDHEFSEGLAQCERSLIVVSHEAYGYLTQRYGLEQLGVAGLDPESEPSPARVAEVHDTIRAEDVTTVFYEPLTSADIVQSVADDLGLDTAVLDPIEGLTDETLDEDYLSLMRQNLDALRTANGCA